MKYKAVISDYVWPSLDIEQKLLGSHDIDIVDCNNSTKEELIEEVKDADAIIFCFKEIDAEILEAAKKCKVASRYGIGVDNIDIKEATNQGVVVMEVHRCVFKKENFR